MHRLTKAQARRIAVRAQLLDARRPRDLRSAVQGLTLLQIDPTAAIAPNADLVLWSRLGSSYDPADLKKAVEEDRTLFELDALIRPIGDLGLYLAGASDRPVYERSRIWLHENDRFRQDIVKLLRKSGPLASREIPDTSAVPWASSGWTNNRNVTQMLEFLMMRGEVAIARGRSSSSTSSTPLRCTSLRPSAAGATSPSRSSTATGSSESSMRSPTARPASSG